MKILLSFFLLMTFSAWAQKPTEYLNLFDNKIYSLKTKGVKDFVVDITSTKLTKQINEQKTFGNVKKLVFRTYWTANPERLAIEVLGLPEGFLEAKEGLKASMLSVLDNLLPMTLPQRFAGYKFSAGKKPGLFMATDTTGLAPVPSYELHFDSQDRLTKIVGHPALGTTSTDLMYEKKAFSDGKWVLTSSVTSSSQGGGTLTSSRKLDYSSTQGIGTLASVALETEQKWEKGDAKPVSQSDVVVFENYQINSGAAFKYFLNEADKVQP